MKNRQNDKVRVRVSFKDADPDLLPKLKIIAAERGMTVSKLCTEILASAAANDFRPVMD